MQKYRADAGVGNPCRLLLAFFRRTEVTDEEWVGQVGQGWRPLVRVAIKAARAECSLITDVKEKFGTLRIYHTGSDELHNLTPRVSIRPERQRRAICSTLLLCLISRPKRPRKKS